MKQILLLAALVCCTFITIKAQPYSLTNTGATACLGTASLSVSGAATATQIKWYNGSTLANTVNSVTIAATSGTTVAGGNGNGSATNQLKFPYGVFVDGSGNVYVADVFNNRVQKWAPGAATGTTVAGGNGSGSTADKLNGPTGVYVDGSGNVYVADMSNHRIQKWASGATTGTTVAGGNGQGSAANQLYNPAGVWVDGSGNIYIADQTNKRIQKWASGATTGSTVAGGNGAGSAANQLDDPYGVAVDGSGDVYVADLYNHRIQKWAPGATTGSTVAGGNGQGSTANQLNYPYGVYVDGSGNIYVADRSNNRIQKWAPGATTGSTVAGGNGAGSAANQLNNPCGVYVDGSGNVYASDLNNHRIQKWAQSTTITATHTPTTSGSYTAVVTGSSGASATTNAITVNPLPAAAITGTATACGSVSLTAMGGASYTWSGGTPPLNVAGVNFSASGTYTVTVTNASGCTATSTAAVVVNTNPTAYNVTGTGYFCSGSPTGIPIGLDNSETGVTYQLIKNGGPTGTPQNGTTGSPIAFPLQSAGTYLVVATRTSGGCTADMSGSAVVSVAPKPTTQLVTGTGGYCTGSAGRAVGLSGSQTDINYQLRKSGSNIGAPVSGTTGSAITFGLQTAGSYTVVATNTITGCTATMSGTAVVTINALPTAYNVTGGGAYCAGGAGVAVGVDNSETGVNYQLQIGGSNTGSLMSGTTGSAISFGDQTAAGTYTVVATRTSSGCTASMTGSEAVTITPVVETPAFTAGATSLCNTFSSVYTATAANATSIIYSNPDNNALFDPSTGTATANNNYNFTIRATATGTCGTTTADRFVTILPDVEVPIFTAGATTLCVGGSSTYTATAAYSNSVSYSILASGATINPSTGVVSNVTGNFTVHATAIGDCGIPTTLDRFVTVNPSITPTVSIAAFPTGSITAGTSVTFTATPTNAGTQPGYNWYKGTTLLTTTPTPTYTDATLANGDIITCELTSNAPCVSPTTVTSTNSITMIVTPACNLTAAITGNATACGSVSLTATGADAGGSYAWSGGTPPLGVAGVTFTASGTYTVTVTSAAGCTASTEQVVTVNPAPTVNSVSNQTLCAGSTTAAVTFAGTATTYNWTNDNTEIGLGASGTGTIAAFAATNNTAAPITATVTVTPVGSAIPAYAYITNTNTNTVSVINTATNAVVATIGVGTTPFGVSVSPDGSQVYVANFNSNTVSVINTTTNAVVATVAVGTNPTGVSAAPDGSRVYVTNQSSNNVSVINTATNAVVATVTVGIQPAGVSVSPDASRVYVTNASSNNVSVINTATNAIVTTVSVGTTPRGVLVSPDGSRVYVANASSNNVSVINTASNTVVATVAVGTGPRGVSADPDGSRVYVANFNSNTVSVINTATNSIGTPITTGTGPYGVSVSPDGSLLYVVNINTNNVSVINTATNAIGATVAVGSSPRGFGNFIKAGTPSCTGTPTTFTVTVNPSVTAAITGNATACGSVSLTATGGSTYLWSGGNSTNTAANTFSASGTYTVTVTNAAGCTATAEQVVTLTAAPTFTVCPTDIIQSNDANNCSAAVNYTATAPSTLAYTFAGATVASGSGTGSGATFNKGVTTVTITATSGTCAPTCTFTVTINDTQAPSITACAADISLNADAGLCTATATLIPPTATDNCTLQNNALNFDGADDYVSFATDLSTVTNFTYEAWVYPTANQPWARLLDFGNAAGYNLFITSSQNGSGQVRLAINTTGSNEQLITSSNSLPLNTWTHVAITLDGSQAMMYFNGALEATVGGFTYTPASLGATANNWLGRSQYPDPYYQGAMDEVRLWNVVRTQAEIQASMNAEIAVQAGLIAAYHFNQGIVWCDMKL